MNGKGACETAKVPRSGKAKIALSAAWTFPLNFAEIVSGDGKEVFRERINLNNTLAFGRNQFEFTVDLRKRKWVRLELWDIAANGAFTQQVWLE
ncbi:CehA/McbA family metallohydrolase domain-containing protein [Rufibacter roseolus]|uniref:hypothetical protein n=1 Tax=Rufibacter roseolus TaxID=2817375 RepID=UPI001FED8E09|nr:hypothetical protein [Rufibacter roseolus]